MESLTDPGASLLFNFALFAYLHRLVVLQTRLTGTARDSTLTSLSAEDVMGSHRFRITWNDAIGKGYSAKRIVRNIYLIPQASTC